MLLQLRKIVPTDNMIQETKKEFPLLHEGNTEIFANSHFPSIFWLLDFYTL